MQLSQPTPELPVPDVKAAQAYYRDHLGFEIAWYDAEGNIGAVAHGDCAIFFRQSDAPARPAVFWIFSEDVDAAHAACLAHGAQITTPIADTSWGMRQFTVADPYGNSFHIFHDL